MLSKKFILLFIAFLFLFPPLLAFQEDHVVTILNGRAEVIGLHLWDNFYVAFNRSIREGQDCEIRFKDESKFHALVQRQVNDMAILKTLGESLQSKPLGIVMDYIPQKSEKVILIPSVQTNSFETLEATVYKPMDLGEAGKAFSVTAAKLPNAGSYIVCNSERKCIGISFFNDEHPAFTGKIALENSEQMFFYRPMTKNLLKKVFGTVEPLKLNVDLSSIGRDQLKRPILTKDNTVEYFSKNEKFVLDLNTKSEASVYQLKSASNELFYFSDQYQYSARSTSLYLEKSGSQETKLPKPIRINPVDKVLYSDDDMIVLLENMRGKIDFQMIKVSEGTIMLDLKDIVNAFYRPEKDVFLVFTKDDKVTEYNKEGVSLTTLPGSPLSSYDPNAQLVLDGKGLISDNIIYDIESGDPFYELPAGLHLSSGSHKDCLVTFKTDENSTQLKIIENQKVNYEAELPFGQMKKLFYLENGSKQTLLAEFNGYSIQIPWEIFNTGNKDSWEPFFISGLKQKPDIEYFKYYEDWKYTFEEIGGLQIESITVLSTNTLLEAEGKTVLYPCSNIPLGGEEVKLKIVYTDGMSEMCQFSLTPFSYEGVNEIVDESCQLIEFPSKGKLIFYKSKDSTIYVYSYPPSEQMESYKLPKRVDRLFESRGKLVGVNYGSCSTVVVDLSNFEKTKTYSIKNVNIHDTYIKDNKVFALALWTRNDIRRRYNIHFQLTDYEELPKKLNELRENGKSKDEKIGDESFGLSYKEFSSGDKKSISVDWRSKGAGSTENDPFCKFGENSRHHQRFSAKSFSISSSKFQFHNNIYRISSGSVFLDEQFPGGIFIDVDHDTMYHFKENNLFVLGYPKYEYLHHLEFPEAPGIQIREYDENFLVMNSKSGVSFIDRKTKKIDPRIDFNRFKESGAAWTSQNWLVMKRGEVVHWVPKKSFEE